MSEPIYLFDHKIRWGVFKKVYDELAMRDGGPTPVNFDKVLWRMLRDKQIYIYLDETRTDDPMIVSLELPTNRQIQLISNPQKDTK